MPDVEEVDERRGPAELRHHHWPTVGDRPRRVKIPAAPSGQYTAFILGVGIQFATVGKRVYD